MATTVLKSNQVTFVDTSDARKLEVYIASNLPTVQIYNVNNGNYSPDWSVGDRLRLTTSIYLDSRQITTNSIKWYKQIGTNTKTQLSDTGTSLTVSTNEMSEDVSMLTYHCEVEYQGLTATSQIIFTRTDTGRNGVDGHDGYSVIAQYSVDGLSSWTEELNSSIHKYIRFSYDGGVNYTNPIKIVGQDGTSVSIIGTAYYSRTLTDADIGKTIDSLNDINGNIINTDSLQTGAGYIVDGYLCVYSRSDNKFVCSGTIQGPQGADGKSSFFFVRYATDTNGSDFSEDPNGKTYIGTVVSEANNVPTDKSSATWKWRKFVGEDGKDAKVIVLNGSSQIFKVNGSVITPSTITVTAQAINTTVSTWTYSVDGGKTFDSTRPSGISINGNVVTVTGSALPSDSIVIKATDGTYGDTFTVYKVSDGTKGGDGIPASMVFLTNENISFSANSSGQIKATTFETSVVAYTGTTKIKPVIGTPTELPTGMTLNSSTASSDEIVLSFSIADDATFGATTSTNGTITIPISSPVNTNLKLNWSKINAGAKGDDGVGINSVQVKYGTTETTATKPADDKWSDTIPAVPDGHYLWTRTIIDYTDPNKSDTITYTYAKQGKDGETGAAGSSVTVKSIQYQEGTSATNAPTGTWSDYVVSVAEGKYLWTKTTFSDNKVAYGVAKQGVSGTPASLVNITPSALYFKSTTGANGTFTPQYIYLYPRFQNATYSNWQYSRDGGITWTSVSGASGLTVGTYNSVASSLRVDRSSTLYTNDVTSISFRCNSTTTNVYDTVSIAKIYDVVDLQIGGRNLLKNTDTIVSVTKDSPAMAQTTFSLVDGYNASELIGQQLTVSYFVSCLGDGVDNGGESLTGRFGMHGSIFWMRSTDGATKTTYPFSGYLETRGLNERVSMKTLVTPTDDYDTITSISIILQPFAKPSSTNNNVWKLGRPKLEIGNTATDYSPAPEDLLNEAANVNVMLSNESHFFEATAGGIPTDTSIVLDVVGYKGSIQSATTVGTITGLPSAGMTATVSSNSTTSTKITVAVTSALTSSIADYGVLTIPITVNGHTINKKFNWVKAKAGDAGQPGGDAVTFQVYSNNGYALSINTPSITLQTFAYVGDIKIQSGATYQWYHYDDADWTAISGATNSYLTITRDDVAFSNGYMCKMQFDNAEYIGVATVDDKNDSNKVFTTKPSNYAVGDLWIVGVDYVPAGVEVGTLLRAEHTNMIYADADWIIATKYDNKINDLQSNIDTYNQYFSFDSVNGVTISAVDANGVPSQFSTSLTNERLSFNYGNESIAYINGTKMNIKEAEIESPLTVTGKYSGSTILQAPVINIGNFSIIVESNGSLSIVANT